MRIPLGVMAVLLAALGLASAARSQATAHQLKAAVRLTPSTALTGAPVSASLKGSSVPSGTTLKKVTINWGDTHTTVVHSLGAKPTHTYAYASKYTVRAQVTDSAWKSAVASRAETVVAQTVYWDLFDGQNLDYQAEFTKLPLTAKSKDTVVAGTQDNGLRCSAGMGIGPQSRLWIISYPNGCSGPQTAVIQVFALPFTASSAPLFTLTLPVAGDDDNLTFDNKGDAWVEDYDNKKVYEFQGPFTDNTTLSPVLTVNLNSAGVTPSGIAIDSKGDLFVSSLLSSGTNSIAMYAAPVTDSTVPTFLNGLDAPAGLAFDKHGNLYASINPNSGKGSAIVRYNANNLNAGAKPNIVDKTGLKGEPYASNFAWDASGNLYVADCGSIANVRVYPVATKKFSAKLAPSVTHRNASFGTYECAWGIAIG